VCTDDILDFDLFQGIDSVAKNKQSAHLPVFLGMLGFVIVLLKFCVYRTGFSLHFQVGQLA
jgi:hypothetical protein